MAQTARESKFIAFEDFQESNPREEIQKAKLS
jgi:hypothetical protein